MTKTEQIVHILRKANAGDWSAADKLELIQPQMADTSVASIRSTCWKIKTNNLLDSTPNNVGDDNEAEYKRADVPEDGYDPRETPELTKAIDIAIRERIRDRFDTLDRTTKAVANNKLRGLIISGAPGVGKTYVTEMNLFAARNDLRNINFHSGSISAVAAYTKLHQHRRKGDVWILDDADDIFFDDTALNILKKALDTTAKRVISWGKQSSKFYDPNFPSNEFQSDGEYDEDNDKYPNSFQFDGSVVFITNEDILKKSKAGGRFAPHYAALISRTLYLDLTLHTIRDRIIRIKDIFGIHMAEERGLSVKDVDTLVSFVEAHRGEFIDLSLRMMTHLSNLYNVDRSRWEKDAASMLMKPNGGTTKDLVAEFLSGMDEG